MISPHRHISPLHLIWRYRAARDFLTFLIGDYHRDAIAIMRYQRGNGNSLAQVISRAIYRLGNAHGEGAGSIAGKYRQGEQK